MASGTIVHRKKGCLIPKSYVETLWKLSPNTFGWVKVNGKDGMTITHAKDVSLEGLEAEMAGSDSAAWYFVGKYPATYSEFDVQPFIAMCEDDDPDKPLIASMITGEWIVKEQKSPHIDAWHANDYLIDKLQGLSEATGGDLDKISQLVRSKSFMTDVMNNCKSSGTCVIVEADGGMRVLEQDNKFSREFSDWGWTSNVHSWVPDKVVTGSDAPREKEPVKKSFAEMRGKPVATGQPPIIAPVVQPEKPAVEQPKDFPNGGDVNEPPLRQIPKTMVEQSNLRALKKYAGQISWDGKVPPEMEMDKNGRRVTEKSQVDWAALRIEGKDHYEWRKKKHVAKADVPKPVVVSKSEEGLSAKERLELRKQQKIDEAKAAEEAAKVGNSGTKIERSNSNEYVGIPPKEEQEALSTLLIEILSGERKIAPPISAKETDKVPFSERYALDGPLDVKLEDGDLWTLVHKYPTSAYLLLKECLADLEKHQTTSQPAVRPSAAA